MPLKIYNSLTRKKEDFQPLNPRAVKMYVCGPTVYDEPHIGHLRSAYVFDVMRRYLEYSNYKVTFVRNVTDVDDKIIEKAREAKSQDLVRDTQSVSKKYLELYKADLSKLGILEPSTEPRATEHIKEMIALIEALIQKGAAYASGADVYYSVQNFNAYGELSKQKKDSMLEGVRIDANEKKKDPLDFALWKASKEGEPSWDSPWGKGRPGWHIECSAMSMKYLGESFDIHGGGRDLIFPHHENEIAQSEAATGKPFAKYWIHHGLITVNQQKMSKSLKNYITLKEIKLKRDFSGIEELKFLFLGTHYSAPLDYSDERMLMQKAVRERFVIFFDDLKNKLNIIATPTDELKRYEQAFNEAMDNDFNTPQAIAVMFEMVAYARKSEDVAIQLAVRDVLKKIGNIFGLKYGEDLRKNMADEDIKKYILERVEAKKKKDFRRADEIRDLLLKEFVILKDEPDGSTSWRIA